MNAADAGWLVAPLIIVSGVWIAAACPCHHRRGRHTMKHAGIATEIAAVIADMNRHTRGRHEEAGSDVADHRRRGHGGRHSVSVVPARTY